MDTLDSIEESCRELKNINYKTMLMNGGLIKTEKTNTNGFDKLELFLQNNMVNNKDEPWSKLDKTTRINKLLNYVEKYSIKNELSDDVKQKMKAYVIDCLDKKRFQRVKDVTYDKITGEIIDIPGLLFIKQTKHFTLKNTEKRVSTLKKLAPKKKSVKNNDNVLQHVKDVKEENIVI